MKKQTDSAKKQYQALDKVYEFDKENDLKKLTDKDKKLTGKDKKHKDKGKKLTKNLKYNNFNFNKYQNDKDCKTRSFSSKFDYFKKSHDDLKK